MSELEDLPSWAGRTVDPPEEPGPDRHTGDDTADSDPPPADSSTVTDPPADPDQTGPGAPPADADDQPDPGADTDADAMSPMILAPRPGSASPDAAGAAPQEPVPADEAWPTDPAPYGNGAAHSRAPEEPSSVLTPEAFLDDLAGTTADDEPSDPQRKSKRARRQERSAGDEADPDQVPDRTDPAMPTGAEVASPATEPTTPIASEPAAPTTTEMATPAAEPAPPAGPEETTPAGFETAPATPATPEPMPPAAAGMAIPGSTDAATPAATGMAIPGSTDAATPAATVLGAPAADHPLERPQPAPPRRRLGATLGLVLLGALILFGVGALGYYLAQSQDGQTATDAPAADGADDPAGAATAGEADGTDEAQGADTDAQDASSAEAGTDGAVAEESSDESADDTVTVDVDEDGTDAGAGEDGASEDDTDGTDPSLNAGDRQAVLRGGKVYLTGAVPSEEVGQVIEQKAAAVVGPENVVNEYTIDPEAVIQPGESAPIFVEDAVLFGFNSIEIEPAFLPILDLGTLLLRQNPQASITIVSRTDAVGSEEVNLEVARQRGQAVVDYWESQGVDSGQLSIDARGEEGASESDDPETAARNRRAEFIITGLLD